MSNPPSETAATQTHSPGRRLTFQPEFELLLCCTRTVPDRARIEELAGGEIDWRALFDLASHHGVRLLVYKALRALCWDAIPVGVRTGWENAYQSLTGRNLFLTGELLRIVAAFEANRIPVAVMKGPAIAQMVYGDFALREFSDLDLLIRETDFHRAITLLQKLSYEQVWDYDPGKAQRFLQHVGEYAVTSSQWGTEVDVHWRVATKATALSPAVGDFPAGFQPLSLAGSTVMSFAPQDLPLYLAAQGGWDQWCMLRRICDVAEFLRKYPQADWSPSLEAAQRLGGLRSMLTGLSLASGLLGAELPESAAGRIRADTSVPRLVERAIRKLQSSQDPSETLSRYSFQMMAKQRVRGKIALAYSILMDRTAQDGQWIMLPRPLWWLYGFLRPLRAAGTLLRR